MKKIDLVSFLYNYYGISNSALNKKKLKHDDIKVLFPYIKSCSYCPCDDLEKGNFIGVYDKNNHVKYYRNPRLVLENTEEQVVSTSTVTKISIDNINNLSKEELLKLRRRLRLNDQRKESYIINKIIRHLKEEEPRRYREKKQKILLKESLYD